MEKKKLARSSYKGSIGGVCLAFADYFDIDVTFVRLGWVLFTLLGGAGVLAYIICWVVIPDSY